MAAALEQEHEHLFLATERMPHVALCAASETCTAIRIYDSLTGELREPNAVEAAAIIGAMMDAVAQLPSLS